MARQPEWLDLSDSELRTRLAQRGVDPDQVERMVVCRDETITRHEITRALR